MKKRHTSAVRTNARAVLTMIDASADQDFHTLKTDQLNKLEAEADRVRYQAPKNAHGSRLRYFFNRLQREARL